MSRSEEILAEARRYWPNTYKLLKIDFDFMNDKYIIKSPCEAYQMGFYDKLSFVGKLPFMDAIELAYGNISSNVTVNKEEIQEACSEFPHILQKLLITDAVLFGHGLVQISVEIGDQTFTLGTTSRYKASKSEAGILDKFLARISN